MAVPESSKYLIEQGPVNFQEPLAEYYAKHAQQLEKSLEEWEAHRNQQAKVADDESLVKVMSGLANFSSKAFALKKAIDQKGQVKEADIEAEKKAWQQRLTHSPWWIEHKEKLNTLRDLRYQNNKKQFEPGSEQFDQLKKLTDFFTSADQPQIAQEYMNASGIRLLAQTEMHARHAVAGLTDQSMVGDTDFMLSKAPGSELTWHQRWEAAEGNQNTRAAIFKSYQLSKINHLELNSETISAVLGNELGRQSQTVRGSQQAAAVAAVATADDARILTQLQTANRTGSLEDAIWSVRNDLIASSKFKATEFKTENQQVDEYLFKTLNNLAIDGHIKTSQLQPYIDSGFKHPAGKDGVGTPGTLFFTPEQVNLLVSNARFGEGRYVALKLDMAKQQLGVLKKKQLDGENVTAELNYLSQRYPELKEQIEDVRNTNLHDQTTAAYKEVQEEWRVDLENGNIVNRKEEAKLIKNDQFRTEVLAKIEHHEKMRGRLNYDERWIDVLVSEGLNLTLKTDEPLNYKGTPVRNDLLDFFRKDFQSKIETDPDNPNAFNESLAATTDYWTANGGTDRGGTGKFSPTQEGSYDNYNKYTGLKSERRTHALSGSDDTAILNHQTKVNQAVTYATTDRTTAGATVLERVLNKPLSVLDAEDILGAFENGTYSHEIILKARQLGVTPWRLLSTQTNALAASDHKDLIRNLDMAQAGRFNSEQALYGALQRSTDQDMLYLFTRKGIENMSPNQLTRLEALVTANQETRTAITEGEKVQQDEIRKGMEEIRALTHPDGTPLYEEEAIRDLLDQGAITRDKITGKLLIYGQRPFSLQKK